MSLPYKQGKPGADRVWNSTLYGAGFGTIVGSVRGAWEFGAVKGESAVVGLSKALNVMAANAVMFGGVALVYSAVEAGLETTRGEADWKNGALAGLAAGSVVGLKTGSIGAAAGSGIAFCLTSIFVDASNGRSRNNPFYGDGVTNPYQVSLGGMSSRRF